MLHPEPGCGGTFLESYWHQEKPRPLGKGEWKLERQPRPPAPEDREVSVTFLECEVDSICNLKGKDGGETESEEQGKKTKSAKKWVRSTGRVDGMLSVRSQEPRAPLRSGQV